MIFFDTSAWVALADARERHHPDVMAIARRVVRGEFGRVVSTDYVLDETYTIVRMKLGLEAVRELRDRLRASRNYEIMKVSQDEFDQALSLMLEREDRRWSLTDCTSFLVMRALGIVDALTLDRNFSEAGFRSLPSPEERDRRQ